MAAGLFAKRRRPPARSTSPCERNGSCLNEPAAGRYGGPMKEVGLVAFAALTALALAAGATDAQTNAPPSGSGAAKQKAVAPTIAVTVTNRRGVTASEF